MNGTRDVSVARSRTTVPAANGLSQSHTRTRGCVTAEAGLTAATAEAVSSGEADTSRMGGDGLPDKRQQLVAKDLAIELPGVLSQLQAVPVDRLGPPNCADQAVHLLALEQHASLAVDDRVQGAPSGLRDNRSAAGIRLQGRNPEVFLTRKHEAATARVQLLQFGVRDVADELHIPTRARTKFGLMPTAAHDLQRDTQASKGVDRQVNALVGHQPRDDQIVVVNRRRRQRERIAID